jgi:uncharacterized protein
MRSFLVFSLALVLVSCGGDRKRSQEPVEPLPYQANDITFTSVDGDVVLAGTLTTPEKDELKTAVVLLSGSGPDNRDYENQFDHKPFLVLSDHLTRRGISVLRYDERGVGESKGDYASATYENLVADAVAAVKFLQEKGFQKIGVIGHSEGGGMAPLVALKAPVNFLVLMAPDNAPADSTLVYQTRARLKRMGASKAVANEVIATLQETIAIARTETDPAAAEEKMKLLITQKEVQGSPEYKDVASKLGDSDRLIKGFLDPKFVYRLNNDPKENLKSLRVPVMILYGELDDVLDVRSNLHMMKTALDSTRHEEKIFPGVGHLFMAEIGLPAEYARDLEQTLDVDVLIAITDWIKRESSQ